MLDDILSAAYLFAMISFIDFNRPPVHAYLTLPQFTTAHILLTSSAQIVNDHVGRASPASVGHLLIGERGSVPHLTPHKRDLSSNHASGLTLTSASPGRIEWEENLTCDGTKGVLQATQPPCPGPTVMAFSRKDRDAEDALLALSVSDMPTAR
jgi:hypothetical protein